MWLINTYTISMPIHAYEFLLKLQNFNLLVYLEMGPQGDSPYLAIRILDDLKDTFFQTAKTEEISKFLSLVQEDNMYYLSLEEAVVKTIFSENFYYETE